MGMIFPDGERESVMITEDELRPGGKLRRDVRRQIIEALAKDEDPGVISGRLGVSRGTIARIRRYAQGEINEAAGRRIDGTPVPVEGRPARTDPIRRVGSESDWLKAMNMARLSELVGEIGQCLGNRLPIRQEVFEEYNRRTGE